MKIELEHTSDVLVLGAGLAGISAAVHAADEGSSVILAAKGPLFSGSSFYPGTWGLGLIGPENEEDEADLAETIEQVGCHMTDPELVRTLVAGIHPALCELRAEGVKLRRADHGGQREFIPCFDHKHRDWNGIEFDSVREVLGKKIQALGITVLPDCDALTLVRKEGRVCGAVVLSEGKLRYLGCKSLVLATGGYGSLFQHHLCTEDVEGIGQAMALDAGCTLVNMEFMQVMPGYLTPAYKTVFNEKTFRFAEFRKRDGSPLLTCDTERILDLRSGHGPFTCRLDSKAVDLALFDAWKQGEPVTVSYSEEMQKHPPEFVKTYFDWLEQAKGLTMADTAQIGLFSHAANGGIRIDREAYTGVPGLYAAGEVTGGMHGADRLGGLSTANGLVFGGIAGRSAAQAAADAPDAVQSCTVDGFGAEGIRQAQKKLQAIMSQNAMVVRREEGLRKALDAVQDMEVHMPMHPTEDPSEIAAAMRFKGRLHTAEAVLQASLLRKESRGSHYREDYPKENESMEHPILLHGGMGHVCAAFSEHGEEFETR